MKHKYTNQELRAGFKKGSITLMFAFFLALTNFGQTAVNSMSQVQQGVCPTSNELYFDLPWAENFGLGGALSWSITKDGESEPEYTGQYGYYTYSIPDYQVDFFQGYCLEGGCYTIAFSESGFGDVITADAPLTITNGSGSNVVEPLTGDLNGYSFEFCTGASGCTAEEACNYDDEASIDDGSCEYLSCSCGTAVYDMKVEQDCIDLEAASFIDSGFGCSFPADFNIAWNGNTNTGYLIPSFGATAAYVDLTFCDITYEDATSASYVSGYDLSDEYGFTPNNTFIVQTQDGNYYAIGNIQVVDIQPTEISIDFVSRLIESNPGCMDENACNYDADATQDDDSCVYADYGFDCEGNCLGDPITAQDLIDQTYWSFTIVDCFDGTVYADNEAVSFNEAGNIDFFLVTEGNELDINPEYGEMNWSVTGDCLVNFDFVEGNYNDGILYFESKGCLVLEPAIAGCTDESACNFDPEVDFNDPTLCDFESCYGCLDESACNFDPEASSDNFSCEYAENGFDCDGNCLGETVTPEDLINQTYWSVSFVDCQSGEQEFIDEVISFNQNGMIDFYYVDEFGVLSVNNDVEDDIPWSIQGDCVVNIYFLDALFTEGVLFAEFKGCMEFAPVEEGCLDETACNYDNDALVNNPDLCTYDCYGCTDPEACNFDPEATGEGECDYESCGGCTDENADNYDFFAELDNGTCLYNDFCISAEELTLDSEPLLGNNTNAGGSLNEADCFDDDDVVNSVWYALEVPEGAFQIRTILDGSMDDSMMEIYEDCAATQSIACNDDDDDLESQIAFDCGELTPGSMIYIRIDGYDESIGTFSILAESLEEAVEGCMDETAANYNACANIEDDSCEFEGCTDETAANYDENATIDDGSCTFEGCTDETAANYNENANMDDGSCQYEGCTDETALNYDENATIDDGSCEYNCFEPTVLYDLDGCHDDEDGFSVNLNVLNTEISGPFIISNNINGDELLVSEDGDYTYGSFDEDEDVVIILTSTITPNCFVSSNILACPLSIIEPKEDFVWNVYPNPANSFFNISFDSAELALVNIYDARGRLVESHQVNQNLIRINTGDWASGMYHVRVIGNGHIATKSVIVQP